MIAQYFLFECIIPTTAKNINKTRKETKEFACKDELFFSLSQTFEHKDAPFKENFIVLMISYFWLIFIDNNLVILGRAVCTLWDNAIQKKGFKLDNCLFTLGNGIDLLDTSVTHDCLNDECVCVCGKQEENRSYLHLSFAFHIFVAAAAAATDFLFPRELFTVFSHRNNN